jgi:hypothetical protein
MKRYLALSMPHSRSTFRVSLAGVMALVAVAAALLRWPGLSYLAISIASYGITYCIGRATTRRTQFAVLLGAIYIPCLFGFGTDCSHCREAWLELFPITPTAAPSLLALHFLKFGRLPDQVEFCLSAAMLCILLFTLATMARRGRAWLLASAVFGFAWSCFWAWVFHALLRA